MTFTLESRDVEALRTACRAIQNACKSVRVSPIYGDVLGRKWVSYLTLSNESRPARLVLQGVNHHDTEIAGEVPVGR